MSCGAIGHCQRSWLHDLRRPCGDRVDSCIRKLTALHMHDMPSNQPNGVPIWWSVSGQTWQHLQAKQAWKHVGMLRDQYTLICCGSLQLLMLNDGRAGHGASVRGLIIAGLSCCIWLILVYELSWSHSKSEKNCERVLDGRGPAFTGLALDGRQVCQAKLTQSCCHMTD